MNNIDPRREARVTALQCLFAQDLLEQSQDPLEWLATENDIDEHCKEFARTLIDGVRSQIQYFDEKIYDYAPIWPTNQLPAVDRNILRLALFEILVHKKAPIKSVVNEAVELSKTFGSETSARFTNGVLGSVVSDMGREITTTV
ncbi:MAG: transcription antitermination factor NusB [Chloroflexota bacterium]|nr:transcription antitermination factor NusB [Chloroflexota bacterium]